MGWGGGGLNFINWGDLLTGSGVRGICQEIPMGREVCFGHSHIFHFPQPMQYKPKILIVSLNLEIVPALDAIEHLQDKRAKGHFRSQHAFSDRAWSLAMEVFWLSTHNPLGVFWEGAPAPPQTPPFTWGGGSRLPRTPPHFKSASGLPI